MVCPHLFYKTMFFQCHKIEKIQVFTPSGRDSIKNCFAFDMATQVREMLQNG
jgi:hypothetical protein